MSKLIAAATSSVRELATVQLAWEPTSALEQTFGLLPSQLSTVLGKLVV